MPANPTNQSTQISKYLPFLTILLPMSTVVSLPLTLRSLNAMLSCGYGFSHGPTGSPTNEPRPNGGDGAGGGAIVGAGGLGGLLWYAR